jgi:phage terminase small subunit
LARAPDQRVEEARRLFDSGMKLIEISEKLSVPEGTVRSWKNRYKWNNATLQKNKRNVAKKKRGGQPGNKNAVGHGAPKGNQNATKHGLFSRYLPEDTREMFFSLDSADPLDLLWDQIKLAYTAIMRAQQIMHVRDQKDKTVEKVEEKDGNVIGERWEVQQAWDKQASFLQAQAKAQKELTTMIKQYEELLHKNWDLATKEQKARIKQLKAKTEQIQGADQNPIEDKVKKLFDAIGGALDESE